MHATEFIQQQIYRGNQVDAIYFDLSKAFDRVDHYLMAKKIAKLGMPLTFMRAIMAFITNRISILKSEGNTHNITFTSRSAVPQGSCCGPILFLIYCMDIPQCVANTNVLLLSFADDTKFLTCVRSDDDRKIMQKCIDKLVNWARLNRMNINPTKTSTISYTNNGKQKIRTAYYVGLERIKREKVVRDLGVTFDNQLTFKNHIQRTTQKATIAAHTARRFVQELNAPLLIIQVAKTYILPITDYCAPVWTHHRVTDERKLEAVQKIITRIALRRPWQHNHPNYITYEDRRRRLRLMTMRQRREIASITFIRRLHTKEISCTYLRNILIRYRNRRPVGRRIPLLYNLPRTTHRKNSLCTAMRLANEHRFILNWRMSGAANKRRLKEHILNF